jgi:hypothetical protein
VRVPIHIVEYATRELVEAELFDEVTVEHFLETQKEWRPVVLASAKQLAKSGAPGQIVPRHFHWDWSSKEAELQVLAFSFFGITCKRKLQGLMKLDLTGRAGRLPAQKGKPVVYVDYLETAPWNIKALMQALGSSPQYSVVGTRLIEAAVQKSIDEGFKGRVALHSLSGSERFYLEVCGMTEVHRDPAKQNLLWCEFTPEQAEKFLAGGAA